MVCMDCYLSHLRINFVYYSFFEWGIFSLCFVLRLRLPVYDSVRLKNYPFTICQKCGAKKNALIFRCHLTITSHLFLSRTLIHPVWCQPASDREKNSRKKKKRKYCSECGDKWRSSLECLATDFISVVRNRFASCSVIWNVVVFLGRLLWFYPSKIIATDFLLQYSNCEFRDMPWWRLWPLRVSNGHQQFTPKKKF